jgi:hypothetical protein
VSDEKVINLHKGAGTHEPPEGWNVRGQFGFMEFDSGAADGRLARLGDVLRWLEDARGLPRSKALEVLIDGLPNDASEWMYTLRNGAYAERLPVGYMFGFHTRAQHEEAVRAHNQVPWSGLGSPEWQSELRGRRVISPGFGGWGAHSGPRPAYQGPKVSEPGLPVLRLALGRWADEKRWVPPKREWVNTTDFEGVSWPMNYLAVPLSKAFEWWGYGKLAEQASPTQAVTQPADDLVGLPESLRKSLLRVEAERKEANATKGKNKRGALYSSFQRVTMAEAVDALNKLRPGTGRRVVAAMLDISEKSLDDATEPSKLAKAKADELKKSQALTGANLIRPQSGKV